MVVVVVVTYGGRWSSALESAKKMSVMKAFRKGLSWKWEMVTFDCQHETKPEKQLCQELSFALRVKHHISERGLVQPALSVPADILVCG